MSDRPLAILMPTLANVMSGRCSRLRRGSSGALAKLQHGDRLWIREPFYLNDRFDEVAPTLAHRRGAWPSFATDFWRKPKPAGLGKRRSARELLREWHRHHLVVTAIERQNLQDITDAEARAEGFLDRLAWAVAWDQNAFARDEGRTWANNPEVLVFAFGYVAAALPALPPRTPAPGKKRGPKPGNKFARPAPQRAPVTRTPTPAPRPTPAPPAASAEPAAPPTPRIQLDVSLRPIADGRSWCSQCERRVSPDEGRACLDPFCKANPLEIAA